MVEDHLRPLLAGREANRIEELYQLMMQNAYWRYGPVINNAISGVDMALWDIKGKQAGLPVYELLGGKYREAAAVYLHANGSDFGELEANARAIAATGVRHIRVQFGGYGGLSPEACDRSGDGKTPPDGAQPGEYFDSGRYRRSAIEAIGRVRSALGEEVELLHDVHERLHPAEAVAFARDLEPMRLFFLEDPLAPEDNAWFRNIRAVSTTPLAMGELFTNPREWVPLITGRQIDFLRLHLSDVGGLTPALKAAILAEMHGVRTAWHGPPDLSPIGHAANLHLDLARPNFGIQEFSRFNEATREVFPGCPELRGGYLYGNDQPGWGVDIDEAAAAEFPCPDEVTQWTQTRRMDGGLARP
jgi:mannonate dehydratase